ncbi:cell division protein FtsI [Paenibacillus antarcticus]|uniref:Cell division protein FtsI n=3 Tax=Paenibacillus antarcticus TaxID=253703 RepID=A0A162ME83_9BACL|nr:cell division protein FtsI [Paenibacillus antarcticus]
MNQSMKKDQRKAYFALRINVFFFSTFIIFCVIIVRLAILQFVEGATLTEKETNGLIKTVALSPIRGTIYDDTHTKLAYSTPIRSLFITLMQDYSLAKEDILIKKKKPLVRAEAFKLAEKIEKALLTLDPEGEKLTSQNIIDAMDLEFLKGPGYQPRRIKTDLNPAEIAYFSENKTAFPGIEIEIKEESNRHYNQDTIAVQTVGYIKYFKSSKEIYSEIDAIQKVKDTQKNPGLTYTEDEIVGYDGIEFAFQDELRGQNGYKEISVTAQNMPIAVERVVPPQKGHDIYLTINKNVQLKAEQAITDQLQWLHTNTVSGKTHPNAITGYAVAMEVDTGKVIAMASMPDYNTNVWKSSGSKNISTQDYEKIKNNYQNGTISPISSGKSVNGLDSLLLLGSTIKPLSVLIGLKENLFGINDYYTDRGITYIGKEGSEWPIRNSSSHVLGSIDPAKAIKESSNVFMVDMIGKRLNKKYPGDEGIKVWDTYMKKFGLGVSTGVDLPKEYLGILEYWNKKQAGSNLAALAYASFGQQGKYTTLQLAQYTTMLANEGKRMKPQLVNEIKEQDGTLVKKFKPEVLNEFPLDKRYWQEIKQGMNTTVSAFEGFPYDFARKTGTSEQEAKGKMRDNGIFIAYAPRDNPKLAIAVVVPEGGFGAQSAAPIARKIFDAYDQEYGLDGNPKKYNPIAESTSLSVR